MLDDLLQDLRHGLRMLLRRPGFTVIAVLTLAIGIGVASTYFCALDTVLLRPLPLIRNENRLVCVNQVALKDGSDEMGICWPDCNDWRLKTRTLENVAVHMNRTFIFTHSTEPHRLLGASISAYAFDMLGVEPLFGRNFKPEEDSADSEPVALLGYEAWRQLFGGDIRLIGQKVPINGLMTRIIGIMPEGWRFPEMADVWMPLRMGDDDAHHGNFYLGGFARLKPGVTLAQAQEEMNEIAREQAKAHPATNAGIGIKLSLYRDSINRHSATLMWVGMWAVVLVHLIACANVANLLLARAVSRTREMAVRAALGASAGRVVRQFLAESFLLGILGCACGLLLSLWGIDMLAAAIPHDRPFWLRFELNPRVVWFAVLTALVSSLDFGLLPALQVARLNIIDELKETARSTAGSARIRRCRNLLVVAGIALALVLLVGAGLMVRSFDQLQKSNPGYDVRDTLTFRVGLPPTQYHEKEQYLQFFGDVLRKLRSLPGVTGVGAVSLLPGFSQGDVGSLAVEGKPATTIADAPKVYYRLITPGYLQTLKIALLKGRDISQEDSATAPKVALIDERAALRFFPGQNPIGKKIQTLGAEAKEENWYTVVGVVATIKQNLREQKPYPTVYVPFPNYPTSFMSVLMRVNQNPSSYERMARATVFEVNKNIPIYNVMTMEEVLFYTIWEKKFFANLLEWLAGIALLLASMGLYGVMAFNVSQRTREIGIRMALGAPKKNVLLLVVGQGARLVLTGVLFGLAAALLVTRLMPSELFGVEPADSRTIIFVSSLLIVVALLASYLPARRAARVDPMEALRYE